MSNLSSLAFISLIAVLVAGSGCLGFFEGYIGSAQKMSSADYAISQYKFFIDKYNTIRQMGSQIFNAQSSIDEFKSMHPSPEFWSRTENDNFQQLSFTRDGYIQQYNKFVADYNSRMRDVTTNQAWMKPTDYPPYLDSYLKDSAVTASSPPLLVPSTIPSAPSGWEPPASTRV